MSDKHDTSAMQKPVPLWLRITVFLTAFGVALYWFATVSGPYRWLIEVQYALVGGFTVMPTVGVVFITTMATSVMVGEALGALLPSPPRPAETRERGGFESVGLIVSGVIGAALLGVAGWFAFYGAEVGEPVNVDLAELDGAGPTARFVVIAGHPLINKRVTVADGVNLSNDTHYIPVEDERTSLFVKVSESELQRARTELATGNIVGMLERAALPEAAASQWRVRGHLVPARVWLLAWDEEPPDERATALPLAATGAFLLLLATALLVARRRNHKAQAAS